MTEPLIVFITYAHQQKDKEAKKELITRLDVMKQEGLISIWHDNEITAGDKWREEIFSTNLPNSDLLLYLVSAYSLASKNCNKELTEALKENIRVIPIILENCDWQKHALNDFQALPDEGKPITKWEDSSEAWQSVVEGIRKAIIKMQSEADPLSGVSKEELLSETVFQHGNVMMMLGQVDGAIEAYSNAIDLKPDDADAYNNRGVAYYDKGEYDLAIKDYNTAIELEPDDAQAYMNRGNAHKKKGNFDCSIEDHNTAIELNPDYGRCLL